MDKLVLQRVRRGINRTFLVAQRLIGVKWYLDGDLLKYVEKKRECWEAGEPLDDSKKGPNCNIDPSKIILVNVKRSFHGNYSCAGRNRAGWGLPSPPKELVVNYQPSEAKIKALPEIVIKGQPFQVQHKTNKNTSNKCNHLIHSCFHHLVDVLLSLQSEF